MRSIYRAPAEAENTQPVAAIQLNNSPTQTRRGFAVFIPLVVCLAAALSLPVLAAVSHGTGGNTPTITKLHASATKVKVDQNLYFTADVMPSSTIGNIDFYAKY